MTAAAYLPAPPRPPHDPLWLSLNPRTGWRLADLSPGALPRLQVNPPCGGLILPPLPGTARDLGEANGSLGGLLPPANVAFDNGGGLWLLDRKAKVLRRFDLCACRFVSAPCRGLTLVDPRAITIDRGRLYVVDVGPPGRLLVLDWRAMTLRAIWSPPAGAVAKPWSPTAVAVWRGVVWVADAASGALHRFAPWGGWRGVTGGMGAISRLAFDCAGRLYVVEPGRDDVDVRTPEGALIETVVAPGAVSERFPDPPLPVSRTGAIDLSGRCEGAGWFDASGAAIAPPDDDALSFVVKAASITSALDSRIARCEWHRVTVDVALPAHGILRIETTTAETELPDNAVALLPDAAWTAVPLGPGAREALILSGRGRYLWARITLAGDGAATPVLNAIDIEYPRISLRRYLPAAFGADPVSAGFADRFLGVFDRGLRDLETIVDDEAALFDPRSTPAAPDKDFLSWLAAWIGVTLDKRWPVARRRRFLRKAGRLFACRGTWPGMRSALLLWLGWDCLDGLARSAPVCAPACTPPRPRPQPPLLVLEHWKLRRWLFLGAGRLSGAAELWGAKTLNRSQLDRVAQVGVTRLDALRDPLRDPFHRDAHRLSVFVPAHAVATPQARAAFARLVVENAPAHVKTQLVPVFPRMRIGIQASLGFDSVVGCWPPGLAGGDFALGSVQLGRTSVLPGAAGPGGMPPRLGRDSRLRRPFGSSSGSTGEVQP